MWNLYLIKDMSDLKVIYNSCVLKPFFLVLLGNLVAEFKSGFDYNSFLRVVDIWTLTITNFLAWRVLILNVVSGTCEKQLKFYQSIDILFHSCNKMVLLSIILKQKISQNQDKSLAVWITSFNLIYCLFKTSKFYFLTQHL